MSNRVPAGGQAIEGSMEAHETYQAVVTATDVDAAAASRIEERIEGVYDETGGVRLEADEASPVELAVPEEIPRTRQDDVRAILREELSLDLGRFERLILELHVSWPDTRYRICVGYE